MRRGAAGSRGPGRRSGRTLGAVAPAWAGLLLLACAARGPSPPANGQVEPADPHAAHREAVVSAGAPAEDPHAAHRAAAEADPHAGHVPAGGGAAAPAAPGAAARALSPDPLDSPAAVAEAEAARARETVGGSGAHHDAHGAGHGASYEHLDAGRGAGSGGPEHPPETPQERSHEHPPQHDPEGAIERGAR